MPEYSPVDESKGVAEHGIADAGIRMPLNCRIQVTIYQCTDPDHNFSSLSYSNAALELILKLLILVVRNSYFHGSRQLGELCFNDRCFCVYKCKSANIGTLGFELKKKNVCLFYNVSQKCLKLKGEYSSKGWCSG